MQVGRSDLHPVAGWMTICEIPVIIILTKEYPDNVY
jgi:hypothetical protein